MKEFSFSTIDDFDNHINSSIFGYTLLDALITSIVDFIVKQEGTIVDLGCTSGRLLHTLKKQLDATNRKCDYFGYDITDHNFQYENCYKADITSPQFIIPKADVILSVFTLQFLSYKDREELLRKIYTSLNPGGCFIFCEKEFCQSGKIQEIFTFSNYEKKMKNFSATEILEKEKTLRKIMQNLTSRQNIGMLYSAGFNTDETSIFFKSLAFTGYLCLK